MDNFSPRVSIVMPVYNGSQYLREAIESMLSQTFDRFEFLIINDASTDDSQSILSEYASRDTRIRIVENAENIGVTRSLNKALHLAKGAYIARQDADDLALPHRLEKQVDVLDAQSEVVLVSSDIEVIDAEGRFIRIEKRSCPTELVSWYLTFYNHIGGHSQVMYRREVALALGGYDESCRYSQDYEFWCRLDKAGKIYILPEALNRLRRHGKGITAEKRSDQLSYSFQLSKNNIAQLIDEELSVEELSALKRFWAGQMWNNFPDSRYAARLHDLHKRLATAYAKKQPNADLEVQMKNELNQLIGRQFIRWASSLNPFFRFLEKTQVSAVAVRWAPYRTLLLWIKTFPVTLLSRVSRLKASALAHTNP